MKIKKPIVFFDLETTGLSQTKDRIIELYMLKENPDGTEEEYYSRFNPYPIEVSESAQNVHGISNEDLKDEPKFSDKAEEILKFMEGSDISGYNILYFDIPMLFEEFHRSGKLFNYRNYRILDSYRIWTYFEPRTLTGAANRFLGEGIENAHRAKNDVVATKRIFHEQMKEWFDGEDFTDMANKTTELDKKVDLSGKFVKDDKGNVTLTFGKHANKPIQQIYVEDPDYFRWMYEKAEMPTDTKMIARRIYARFSEKNE